MLERRGDAALGSPAALAAHGHRPALSDGVRTVTYAELADLVADVGARLGSERRLVVARLANDLDAVVAYLGALIGGHAVLVVQADDTERAAAITAGFDPDAVVGGGDGGPVVELRRPEPTHELHPDLALLLSTSGSTGSPRLVRLSARGVEANAAAIAEYLALTPDDRAVTTLPLHYCYGLSVLHSHLVAGASVVLTELSVLDRCFWDLFRRTGATSFAGVPHTFELLDRVGFIDLDLPTLRYVTQAGGRMDPGTVRRYAAAGRRAGWDLVVMYGQTEATARMAYLPPHLAEDHPWSIGVPIPGGDLSLAPVDDAEPELGPDVGELVYRGENVMLGYAHGPADLARGREVHELRTGDLARRHPDGLYEIVGRRTRFAKIAGLRLDLDHLERGLRAEGIAAVCASDDHRVVVGLEAPVAEVAPLAASVAERCGLPPSRVLVVDLGGPARLPNGKPDHRAVLAAAATVTTVGPAGPDAGPDRAPAGIDPAVWAAVAPVLGTATANPEDTFVSLGGDSLSYVEVSLALESVLGDLPPDWHTTPLGRLVPGARRRRWARVETSVVARAVSIVLVVGSHVGLFELLGGAHLLLAVGGWNYARFNAATSDRLRSVARIALPSAAWLALVAATVAPRVHLDHVLLVHGWFGDPRAHGGYWYIEAITQILLALAALLAVPPAARLLRRHPFGVPLALAGAGLAVRFGVVDLPTPEPHDIRSHDIFWLFALGWAGARAHSLRSRLLVSGLLVAAVPGYFGEPQREVLVLVGTLLVVWVRTLPLPRPAARVAGHLGAASLAIYLTHWQVFPPVRDRVGQPAAFLAALLGGVLVWWASRTVSRRALRAWRQRRASSAAAPPSVEAPTVASSASTGTEGSPSYTAAGGPA